jgi:hypothetical protein
MISTPRDSFTTVVPAKAGTHTPCTLDGLVVMGPRFRGDDSKFRDNKGGPPQWTRIAMTVD